MEILSVISRLEKTQQVVTDELVVLKKAVEILNKYNSFINFDTNKRKNNLESKIIAYLHKCPDSNLNSIHTFFMGQNYSKSTIATTLSRLYAKEEVVKIGNKLNIFTANTGIPKFQEKSYD